MGHWAHLRGGSLTAPVLAPVLILANCPNAIVSHRSDPWHVDSCLLDMRGHLANSFCAKNLFIGGINKSCKHFLSYQLLPNVKLMIWGQKAPLTYPILNYSST